MFWYQNMVRYARKHFSAGKVLILRLAIFKGMGLRMHRVAVWRRTAAISRRASLFGAMREWHGGRLAWAVP